jgi:hypothetical protein
MLPSSSHQRFEIQRSINEIDSQRLNSSPSVKPPREVFLRVKFIRLGEVSSHFSVCFSSFVHYHQKQRS